MSMIRTRWAAVGAAVAITLGAGGIGLVSATSPSGASAFVPITPCRLADIRPDTIGAGDTMTFDGWGSTGDCTLPTGTTGLALNVTAVGATQQTNLRFYPTGTPTPETANLNPTPGAPPTPNAVNVALSTAGQFDVYNRFGDVAIVIDVMGYYTDHTHDDYAKKTDVYTKAEVDSLVFDGTIPSGVTIVGNLTWDSHGSTNLLPDRLYVAFPGRAPVPLTDTKVNFNQPGVTGDGDPECTGGVNAPTAPAGKVCIYLVTSAGMATNQLYGNAGYPLADAGFELAFFPNGTDDVDQFVYASWAYTAP